MFALLALLFVSSCSKEWTDINQNPNAATAGSMTADLIVPQAMSATAARNITSYGFLGNWLGFWSPSGSFSANSEESSYNITTNFGAGLWSNYFDNIYDFEFAQQKATASKQGFYVGICKIMKVFNYQQLMDLYGNVPYSEALKGTEIIRPKYDKAQDVYDDLVKQIDAAQADIKGSSVSDNINITAADIMFKGDKTKWYQFSNTLKLRILMHQSEMTGRDAYIKAEIAKIVAQGSGFLPSGLDAAVNPGYIDTKPNPYWASYGFTQTGGEANSFFRANNYSMNILKNNKDPRLGYIYKLSSGDKVYKGIDYGLPPILANGSSLTSNIGGADAPGSAAKGLAKGYSADAWLITSTESLFLQAEAIQRGWLTGTAKTAYNNAVTESFKWLNVVNAATEATTYLTQPDNANTNWDLATNKLSLIMNQKYMAMNGVNHLEAWTDYRRTDIPNNLPLSVAPARTSTKIPVRLLYPQREYDINKESVLAQGTINQFDSRLFWDIK